MAVEKSTISASIGEGGTFNAIISGFSCGIMMR
jgi:hypothetical protein